MRRRIAAWWSRPEIRWDLAAVGFILIVLGVAALVWTWEAM